MTAHPAARNPPPTRYPLPMASDDSLDTSQPGFPSHAIDDAENTKRFALELAAVLRDDKCEHLVVLDVRQLSQVWEYIIIGSGTSSRQMRSALEDCQHHARATNWGHPRVSADQGDTWLLADFVHVVVHLFEPNTRAYYDLETFWGDAPRLNWRELAPKPGEISINKAATASRQTKPDNQPNTRPNNETDTRPDDQP